MVDVEAPVAVALRRLQLLDEVESIGRRDLLVEAQSQLGRALGLSCTGRPGIWNEDGTVAGYDHSGGTCPVHEWLVPADAPKEVSRESHR